MSALGPKNGCCSTPPDFSSSLFSLDFTAVCLNLSKRLKINVNLSHFAKIIFENTNNHRQYHNNIEILSNIRSTNTGKCACILLEIRVKIISLIESIFVCIIYLKTWWRMILHFLFRKNKKSKVATTLMKMIVNRGATIITQTWESVVSSSEEVPWNGVTVTLLKENEIWLILNLKVNTVKTQFGKNHQYKENLCFLYYIWHFSLVINDSKENLTQQMSPYCLWLIDHLCVVY